MGFTSSPDPEPVDPSPSPCQLSVIDLVKSAREDVVIQHLTDHPDQGLDTDMSGRTALHWAVEFGYFRLVRHLVDVCSNCSTFAFTEVKDRLINKPDDKGQTALHVACNTRQPDLASFLLTTQADITSRDISGNTPLHRAVRNDVTSAARRMCQTGADVNATNDVMWTPLHEATRTGNQELLRVLIQYGADTSATTSHGMSPFLTAFFYYKISARGNSYPSLEIVWQTLISCGCKLSQTDGHWSPLTAALACDNTDIAVQLLLHGCQLSDKKGRYGRGLLQETFCCSEPKLVRLMVLLGYLPSREEIQYCVKQIPMYSRVFTRLAGLASGIHRDRQEVVSWLRLRGLEPPSLAEWCRVSIRQAMNLSSGDRSIVDNIQHLPIPNRLKQFVDMVDYRLEHS